MTATTRSLFTPVRILSVFAVLFLTLLPASASAHTELVSSTPAAGSTLAAAPANVSLTFSDAFDLAGSSLTVADASGATVSEGAAMVSPTDQRTMMVALRSGLGDGTYTVNWAAQSVDGHVSRDTFTFTVSATAQPTTTQPTTTAPAQLPATGATSMMVPLFAAAVVLFALGARMRRVAR